MISANWMTLGFANAKRNVQAPARDPSENSARAARNFAEPFSCEAPSGTGPGEGAGRPLRCRGAWKERGGGLATPALSRGAFLGPATAPWTPLAAPPHSLHSGEARRGGTARSPPTLSSRLHPPRSSSRGASVRAGGAAPTPLPSPVASSFFSVSLVL